MAEITNELIYRTLQSLQTEIADLKADQTSLHKEVHGLRSDMNRNLSLLSDGILSLRQEMHLVSLSTAGHGQRLADVEIRLGRIERHVGVPQETAD